jgi:hypothetical protein
VNNSLHSGPSGLARQYSHFVTRLLAQLRITEQLSLVAIVLCFAACGSSVKVSVPEMPKMPPRSAPNDVLLAQVLNRAINPIGQIDYVKIENDTELTEYLRELAVTDPTASISRSASLAFWINAHNACMLDLLRMNWPLRGTFDISQYRGAPVYRIGGNTYSLVQIEHEVLTNQFKDPRAFFALYFGGISSPKLAPLPYAEATLSEQLDSAVTKFVADPRRAALDPRNHKLLLSHLFSDYSPELIQISGTVQAFVRTFATGKLAQYLGQHSNIDIDYLPYDWRQE